VLPYSLTSARRENKAFGINKVGLSRRGFSQPRLLALQKAFRLLLAAKLNTTAAIQRIKDLEVAPEFKPDMEYLVAFIERSQQGRGVIK
jgi:UDP-N-acetylglucosamine acyltransferase